MNHFQCHCGHTRPLHHCHLPDWRNWNCFIFSNYLFKGRVELGWQFYSWIATGQGIWGSQLYKKAGVIARLSILPHECVLGSSGRPPKPKYRQGPVLTSRLPKNKILIKWQHKQLSERWHGITELFLCSCSPDLGNSLFQRTSASQPFS